MNTAFREDSDQRSTIKVNTDSAMKSNSFRLIPESAFGFAGILAGPLRFRPAPANCPFPAYWHRVFDGI